MPLFLNQEKPATKVFFKKPFYYTHKFLVVFIKDLTEHSVRPITMIYVAGHIPLYLE